MKQVLRIILCAFALSQSPLVHAENALSTTITAGYQSRYVLYGYHLSSHLYMTDIYLYYPLNEKVSAWGGSWFGYQSGGTYSEIDVYGGVDYSVNANLTAGLAYSLFNYLDVPFETDDQVSEFAVHLTATAGPLTFELRNHYDTGAEGHLLRGVLYTGHQLNEKLALNLKAEAGYAFDYFIDGNAWNHADLRLSAPYQATESVSINPYIARSIALEAIDSFEKDETYGGISVSYAF
ncbi:MAG: hypothetical protein ACO398_02975 [Kiritimatiellia bacterium]